MLVKVKMCKIERICERGEIVKDLNKWLNFCKLLSKSWAGVCVNPKGSRMKRWRGLMTSICTKKSQAWRGKTIYGIKYATETRAQS